MRLVRHPLVPRDVAGIVEHILVTTDGNLEAAERRLGEIEALLRAILDNPLSGVRLAGPLAGWLVRHGGQGRMITVVLRPEPDVGLVRIAMIAFGARNWLDAATDRTGRR